MEIVFVALILAHDWEILREILFNRVAGSFGGVAQVVERLDLVFGEDLVVASIRAQNIFANKKSPDAETEALD